MEWEYMGRGRMIRPLCKVCGYVTLARPWKLCAYCRNPVEIPAEEE